MANPTAVDKKLRHAVDLFYAHPDIRLTMLFGPEHGIRGEAQDMIQVQDQTGAITGLPVISLYGPTPDSLTPRAEQLAELDVLVFDIQDIGARYYTYAATMALCMRAAADNDNEFIVLDRPNPIGGQVEGGGLIPGLESFCGLYPVPQRHGMTVGELARLYHTTFSVDCDLVVVQMEGWRRELYADQTGLPWVMPSPNMPTLDTAIVYPGMCLLEGTNLSEGRGTTRPFELFGAPFIESRALVAELTKLDLRGVRFRTCYFEPTFHKFAHQSCAGLQLHVSDRRAFEPYRTGLAVLWAVKQLWPEQFSWRRDLYEFRDDVPAIDLLIGNPEVRDAIDVGEPFERVCQLAYQGTGRYQCGRAAALLYA